MPQKPGRPPLLGKREPAGPVQQRTARGRGCPVGACRARASLTREDVAQHGGDDGAVEAHVRRAAAQRAHHVLQHAQPRRVLRCRRTPFGRAGRRRESLRGPQGRERDERERAAPIRGPAARHVSATRASCICCAPLLHVWTYVCVDQSWHPLDFILRGKGGARTCCRCFRRAAHALATQCAHLLQSERRCIFFRRRRKRQVQP